MDDKKFMRIAIAEARDSETPFGAVIVEEGQVVSKAGNTVKPDHDPTCHAEVNAIRQLTRRQGESQPSGAYTLYSTCEPCAMCAATAFWAGITTIVYGVGVDDFDDSNPNLIELRCEDLLERSPSDYALRRGVLQAECKQLHEDFPL